MGPFIYSPHTLLSTPSRAASLPPFHPLHHTLQVAAGHGSLALDCTSHAPLLRAHGRNYTHRFGALFPQRVIASIAHPLARSDPILFSGWDAASIPTPSSPPSLPWDIDLVGEVAMQQHIAVEAHIEVRHADLEFMELQMAIKASYKSL